MATLTEQIIPSYQDPCSTIKKSTRSRMHVALPAARASNVVAAYAAWPTALTVSDHAPRGTALALDQRSIKAVEMGKKRKVQNQPNRLHHDRPQAKKSATFTPPRKPNANKKQHKQVHHEKPTVPFEPNDRILLVGEGDLSFAASLVSHHGCTNVTATVLEKNLEELKAKYPHVDENIEAFTAKEEEKGTDDDGSKQADSDASEDEPDSEQDEWTDEDSRPSKPAPRPARNNRIAYAVDATRPLTNTLARQPYQTIIFNFPHVGGLSTDVNRQVRHNQSLLVSFFNAFSTPRTLAPRGSIVVTIFEGEPYTLWNVRDLARHAGLRVETSFKFRPAEYPGYRHARTCGTVGEKAWKGEERLSRSFVFRRQEEVPAQPVRKKKRRRGEDSSDEEGAGE